MFADHRGSAPHRAGRRAHAHRRSGDRQWPGRAGLLDFDQHAARAKVRVGEDVARIEHRAERNLAAEFVRQLLLGKAPGPRGDDLVDRFAMRDAGVVGGEARIVLQFGPLHPRDQ